MRTTWGPPGTCRPQMGPMLDPWTLLSGFSSHKIKPSCYQDYKDNPWWPSATQEFRSDSIWHASPWAFIVCNSITVASGCVESKDISWIYTASPQFPWGSRRDLLITIGSYICYLCKNDVLKPIMHFFFHIQVQKLIGKYTMSVTAMSKPNIN